MDINEKDKEILFLRDMVEQLQMQVSILQKRIKKKQKNLNIHFEKGCLSSGKWKHTRYQGVRLRNILVLAMFLQVFWINGVLNLVSAP